jgi:hypothetical protein
MQPLLDRAAVARAAEVDLKDRLKRLKKEKVAPTNLTAVGTGAATHGNLPTPDWIRSDAATGAPQGRRGYLGLPVRRRAPPVQV